MFKPHGAYTGADAARQLTPGELAQITITGCHRSNGIFIAWGPDIQPGGQVQGAALIDVAPTALHLLGQPVPVEMDGHVLQPALAGPAAGPVRAARWPNWASRALALRSASATPKRSTCASGWPGWVILARAGNR